MQQPFSGEWNNWRMEIQVPSIRELDGQSTPKIDGELRSINSHTRCWPDNRSNRARLADLRYVLIWQANWTRQSTWKGKQRIQSRMQRTSGERKGKWSAEEKDATKTRKTNTKCMLPMCHFVKNCTLHAPQAVGETAWGGSRLSRWRMVGRSTRLWHLSLEQWHQPLRIWSASCATSCLASTENNRRNRHNTYNPDRIRM